MLVLYTFGPGFGLPDASPFVIKTMLLLKFAGLAFNQKRGNVFAAPKKKLPFIDDDGTIVCNSTFIRLHLERKYGIDFDAGLTAEQKATAWAIEKMCEDHLYFAMVDVRWCDDTNFSKGTARFFDTMPAPLRPLIRIVARRKVRNVMNAQGFGRHTRDEIALLAQRDIAALAVLLGDKPFLMGERPCGADAAVFAMVTGLLTPIFETSIRTAIESHANLVAYTRRISDLYFKPPGTSAATSGTAAA